jgi:hypothetical protein
MAEEELFELNPRVEVEGQVDAIFSPLYSLIPSAHHKLIERLERDMINALKMALRLPATEPRSPDPNHWPFASGERLAIFLSPTQQAELRKNRKA